MLTLVDQTPTSITIRWTAPYDGGSPIRDYLVYQDQTIGSYVQVSPSVGSPYILEYTMTQAAHGLQTGKIYAFKVTAINDVGES